MVPKDVDSMSTKTKKPHLGLAFFGLVAAAVVLAFTARELIPLWQKSASAEEQDFAEKLQVSPTQEETAVDPVEEAEPTATLTPTETLFAGWDAAALDAFCAQQPDGFSVYAQDLETGDVYTYNGETEYYPASTLKAAYALWLCEQAEQGQLDMEGDVYNGYSFGTLEGTKLDAYDGVSMIPAWDVMYAMITVSDNNAMEMLVATWPADESTGFCDFLAELGFHSPYSCSMTEEGGIQGIMNVQDAGLLMQALYQYFETETSTALQLMDCFLDAEHTALYVPEGVESARKYGSWDYAFHDFAIVYAEHPYILCCMTDQGDQTVDFPPAVVEAMQELGKLVYAQESA